MTGVIYTRLRLMRIVKPGLSPQKAATMLQSAKEEGVLESQLSEIPAHGARVRFQDEYFIWVTPEIYNVVLDLFGDAVEPMFRTEPRPMN